MSSTVNRPYADYRQAFEIFGRYPDPDGGNLSAEHDQLWAGPDPADVSLDDLRILNDLGWHADPNNGCFHKFV
jgi:hypothetical protein